jgi:cytochrome c-type biogenesis protein CcmH
MYRVETRRQFVSGALSGLGGGGALLVASRRSLWAQQGGARDRSAMIHDSMVVRDTQNLFAMDQEAARPVTLPPKPNAVPLLTDSQRDDLEHRLRCQCGCTLDVYTCRTTDFSCRVSPAMHRDVMGLVAGGYDAQEIIDAFVDNYGERVLMAPRKSGFDLVAWFAPGVGMIAGVVGVALLLRRWRSQPKVIARRPVAMVDATPDELARLEAAVRGGGEAGRE